MRAAPVTRGSGGTRAETPKSFRPDDGPNVFEQPCWGAQAALEYRERGHRARENLRRRCDVDSHRRVSGHIVSDGVSIGSRDDRKVPCLLVQLEDIATSLQVSIISVVAVDEVDSHCGWVRPYRCSGSAGLVRG